MLATVGYQAGKADVAEEIRDEGEEERRKERNKNKQQKKGLLKEDKDSAERVIATHERSSGAAGCEPPTLCAKEPMGFTVLCWLPIGTPKPQFAEVPPIQGNKGRL